MSRYPQTFPQGGTADKEKSFKFVVRGDTNHGVNIAKFGVERIHNTTNLIKLEHGAGTIHAKISGHYSSIQPFTNGQTVRKWLSTQSYQQQYEYGIKMLKQYGWKP